MPSKLLLLLAAASQTLFSQPQCTANSAGTPSIRAEGVHELTGDLIVICTGGQPRASGAALPQRAVTVTALDDVRITSRDLATGGKTWTEALLLVDDPEAQSLHRVAAPPNLCGTVSGVCSGTGNGTGFLVYSQATPNIYQGERLSPNSIRFTLPWDDPGPGAQRVIRITNLRVDAAALPMWAARPFRMSVAVEGIDLDQASVMAAVAQRSLDGQGDPPLLQSGGAQTRHSVTTIVFTERFPTVWKRRSASSFGATDPHTTTAPPPPANQDIPGTIYQTETGFYRSQFPNIAGRGDLGRAGLADSGTRVFARFRGVPAGVSLWVRAVVPITTLQGLAARPDNRTGTLVALATSGFGTEPFAAAPVDSEGFTPMTIRNGDAVAVWEVINADTTTIERARIDVLAAYPPRLNWSELPQGSLAPGMIDTLPLVPSFAAIPGGTSSNCSYSTRTRPNPVPARGGLVEVEVTTTPACGWSIQTFGSSGWLVPLSGRDFQGPGVAVLNALENFDTARVATLSGINGRIVQDGPGLRVPQPWVTTPIEGQSIATDAITLSWLPVAGATGYQVVVGEPNFLLPSRIQVTAAVDGSSLSTVVSLQPNSFGYSAKVRACVGGYADHQCGPFFTRNFQVVEGVKPFGAPTITAPTAGQVLTASTNEFRWTAVTGATWYKVEFSSAPQSSVRVDAPATSTIMTLPGGNRSIRVTACAAACGSSSYVAFSISLPPVPTTAPVITSNQITGGNLLDASWTAVPRADLYQIQIVQPNTGPGGGALTVASRQVSTTSVQLAIPSGPASILVSACNGNGCGPFSNAVPIQPPGPNPAAPVIGTPMAGVSTSGPTVLFTWNRVPGDNGTNTTYRLYVADLARSGTAADVYTHENFAAVQLQSDGRRYDAVVIANPGTPAARLGPASGFQVSGYNPVAPTLVSPGHNSSVRAGLVRLGWAPFQLQPLFEQSFQYFVTSADGAVSRSGVASGTFVELSLPALNGRPTSYSAVMRACALQYFPRPHCTEVSEAFWGPWSNTPGGSGVTNFTVLP